MIRVIRFVALAGLLGAVSIVCMDGTDRSSGFQQYLGQPVPAETPVRFAADIITDLYYPHSRLIVAPSGDRIYWTTFLDTVSGALTLYCADFDGQNLSAPRVDSAISRYGIYSFEFSRDGSRIYFGAQRTDAAHTTPVRGVWYCEKQDDGWSTPGPVENTLDADWASVGSVSVNDRDDIYFVGRRGSDSPKLYRSLQVGGVHQPYEPLPNSINAGDALDPFIDPSDQYLLFAGYGWHGNIGIIDLYISTKNEQGGWNPPVALGDRISSGFMDRFPSVAPGGDYLFFVTSHANKFPSSQTHFHWVSVPW